MALGMVPLFVLVVGVIDASSGVGTSVSESEAACLFGGCSALNGAVTCDGGHPDCEGTSCVRLKDDAGDQQASTSVICGTTACGTVYITKTVTCGS